MSLFIDRIKEVMTEKNIIPADIARETGISPGTISKYLSDEGKNHSFPIALKIANYLDVSAEWLGGATDVRKPFNEPSILDVYERLSTAGKDEVYNFAKYMLKKEGDANATK